MSDLEQACQPSDSRDCPPAAHAPFGEEILMWWNFVGRDPDEITRAAAAWNAGDARFGEVRGYPGERLTAPLPPWAAR